MAKTQIKYSFWIGIWKSIKNNAYALVPFAIAVAADVPAEYAWISGLIVYGLKNYYENRSK
ncbi:hypothetical protein HN448_04430 [archaeon]|jgi:hypothetical protein|nr:hypothetical protein [archaeon]